MSERKELLPGCFCWPELATPDSARAKTFYAGLFGWDPFDVPSAGGTYTLLRLRGLDVAALRTLSAAEKAQSIPSHFMTYISTASADASSAKVAPLGGKVLHGPFDVEGIGRMAAVMDPGGAVFALWEARGHIGARLVGEDHTLCWSELVTKDPDGAMAFYGGLFGWSWKRSGSSPATYFEILREGQPIGGLLPMEGQGWGDVPPHWMPYFLVPDCDAAVSKASALGGGAAVPATDIPNVGRFAVLRDDQGAHFSVIAMLQAAGA
jgi:predicted enzyme related to lactoylglutathione lyase